MSQLTPEEQLTLATYNRRAKSWSSNHATPSFWGEEMARFMELLPSGRIIEIGAGGGRDARELVEAGYDYLGTDIAAGLLEQARKNNPGLNFEEVSVYDLHYEELFDGFWCSAVLLHIPRSRTNEALQAINKNMKRGAFGFIAVKEGTGERLETDGTSTQSDERLFVYWTNNEFSDTLANNGFEIVEQSYRPMNERTKWLTYIVKVANKELD